jgi:hypothetical protein
MVRMPIGERASLRRAAGSDPAVLLGLDAVAFVTVAIFATA